MEHFLDTKETISEGLGFKMFGPVHITWLILLVLFAFISIKYYQKATPEKRVKIRKGFAIALLINELFKHTCLIIGGNWNFEYLPLHLCSINIFLILWHAYKPNKIVEHFICLLCIPGALMAIISPSWTPLPLLNFMHLHSFTIHILLVTYPLLLMCGKETKPEMKYVGLSMVFMLALCIPIYFINVVLKTNFFFLMNDAGISVFVLFKNIFGNHLMAVPVIGAVLLPLMVFIWRLGAK